MKYTELIQIFEETSPLKWTARSKAFSEGIAILSKYCYSDFPNLHVDTVVDRVLGEDYYVIMYGNISEVLEGIAEHEACELAQLGWFITEGFDENDNYFKYRL